MYRFYNPQGKESVPMELDDLQQLLELSPADVQRVQGLFIGQQVSVECEEEAFIVERTNT